ncbi:hypothetical protein ACO2Q3_13170 [Caulobacter sp. KR2-114]|uniref:hypothetical protein n=1 Tax=Caulobacter sp. KR2-114 TaxID=3400912 RepID=UPI003C008140
MIRGLKKTGARAVLLLAGAALAVLASATPGDARSKPPPEPPVIYAPPPPPPFLPPGLNDRMIADAASFQAYAQRATQLPTMFHDGATVATTVRNGMPYDSAALVRGAAAFGAIAALQEPTFVASLRAAGQDPERRRLMLNRFIADPAYVFTFPGAEAAAHNAKAAIGGTGLRLMAAGAATRQSAYDVQHEAWSKGFVLDPAGRLAAVKSVSAGSGAAAPDTLAALRGGIAGGAPLGLGSEPVVRYETPLVAKAMALAAFAALGEAGDAAYQRLTYLTTEQNTAYCLHTAQLMVHQCLAVAKPHYEDIFCLGQHMLYDTGQCLALNGGGLRVISLPTPKPLKLLPVRGGAHKPVRRHR